jgi:hypothetical protein
MALEDRPKSLGKKDGQMGSAHNISQSNRLSKKVRTPTGLVVTTDATNPRSLLELTEEVAEALFSF